MSRDEKSNQYFDGEFDKDQLFIGIPAESNYPKLEKIPSGYDPMGRIYLEGIANRNLAGGRIPWWVLISGWILYGGYALCGFVLAITLAFSEGWFILVSGDLFVLMLVMVMLPLLILWRGTIAKLTIARRKTKRFTKR
jgi:hypothetical protein